MIPLDELRQPLFVELPGLLLGESPRRTELIGLLADFIYINNEEQLSKRIFGKVRAASAIVRYTILTCSFVLPGVPL